QANIPNERNINSITPERINNIELATRIKFTNELVLNGTFFYNNIQNIIDVGVIYQDPAVFPMVNIGTDVAGDWNGYWYFKNTLGTFSQIGTELALAYTIPKYSIQLTQAVVQVQSATKEQKDLAISSNSMYLAAEDNTNKTLHAKAFPEMVTRLNILANPIGKLNVALNMMYYSDWYSPIGTKAKGGIFANVGVGYNFTNNIEFNISVKNVGNNTNLYPMNSNAGGPDVSPGTPGWESRTFWGTLRVKI
ncbi:MAG: TonB-dependent receptor, partial [Bacteroidetes bacterium]